MTDDEKLATDFENMASPAIQGDGRLNFMVTRDQAMRISAALRAYSGTRYVHGEGSKDAARYRWMRTQISEDMQWYLLGHTVNSAEDMDAAIDDAMQCISPQPLPTKEKP